MTWFYIPSTYSPAPEAESLPTSCSDTAPSAQSKLTPTPDKFCSADKLTVRYLNFLFGTMCEVSQSTTTQRDRSSNDCAESENNSVLAGDFLVRTLAQQGNAPESQAKSQDFGKSLPESFAKFDQSTCSWKTPTSLLDEGLTLYSLTLPKCGILLRGELYRLPTLTLPTCENAFGDLQLERERDVSDRQSGRLETAGSRSSDKTGVVRPSDLRQILSNSQSSRRETISIGGDNEQTQFRPDELRCSLSDAGNDRIVERVRELQEHIENATLDGRGKTVDESRQRRQAESVVGGMADGISHWLDDCRNGTLWTPDEKGLARIAVDVPNRAARLKAIGNAQVPLCAAVAFVTLKEILDNYDT